MAGRVYPGELIGAIGIIKLAQAQNMLTTEQAVILIRALLRTHDVDSTDGCLIVDAPQLIAYINLIAAKNGDLATHGPV